MGHGGAAPGGGQAALDVPAFVLRHRAVLYDKDNQPFSEVVETYTNAVLGFAPPAPASESGADQSEGAGDRR